MRLNYEKAEKLCYTAIYKMVRYRLAAAFLFKLLINIFTFSFFLYLQVTLVVPSILPFPASSTVKHSIYTYPFEEDHLEKTIVPKSHNRSLLEIVQDNKMWIDNFIMPCRALIIHVKLHRKELRHFELMFCDSPPECGAIISEILGLPRIDIKLAGAMRFFKDVSLVSYIPDILSWNTDKMTFLERVANLLYHVLMSATMMYNYALCDELRREFDIREERSFRDSINKVEMVIIMGHFALEYPQPILPGKR